MKKTKLTTLLTLIAATVFWGCPMENYVPFTEWDRRFEPLGLSAERLRRISHDFEVHLWGVCYHCPACNVGRLNYYFGTYNGWTVMAWARISVGVPSVTVAGFDFDFGGWNVIMFAGNNNERIYDVRDALELGFLTLRDIETMYERHNRRETYWRFAHD